MRTGLAMMAMALLGGSALAQESPPEGAAAPSDILAVACDACHGLDGRSTTAIPPIAGLGEEALRTAMTQYRSGERTGTVMNRIARGYDDAQIAAIAAYFSRR